MQTLDWWLLLHPVLAVVLIYPLLGIVVRLGLQARALKQLRLERDSLWVPVAAAVQPHAAQQVMAAHRRQDKGRA